MGQWTAGGTNNDSNKLGSPTGVFVEVSAGKEHSCGVRPDGTVDCWGSNSYFNKLGSPTGVFVQVSAGKEHSCGVRPDGTVKCWGGNPRGESDSPTGVFVQVSAGNDHSCGVRVEGIVECWGDNRYDQMDSPYSAPGASATATCGSAGKKRGDRQVCPEPGSDATTTTIAVGGRGCYPVRWYRD